MQWPVWSRSFSRASCPHFLCHLYFLGARRLSVSALVAVSSVVKECTEVSALTLLRGIDSGGTGQCRGQRPLRWR